MVLKAIDKKITRRYVLHLFQYPGYLYQNQATILTKFYSFKNYIIFSIKTQKHKKQNLKVGKITKSTEIFFAKQQNISR